MFHMMVFDYNGESLSDLVMWNKSPILFHGLFEDSIGVFHNSLEKIVQDGSG